jgi:hypothetical protein
MLGDFYALPSPPLSRDNRRRRRQKTPGHRKFLLFNLDLAGIFNKKIVANDT